MSDPDKPIAGFDVEMQAPFDAVIEDYYGHFIYIETEEELAELEKTVRRIRENSTAGIME